MPKQNFNPRSHKGNDISISSLTFNFCYFNPRSHKGNDVEATLYRDDEVDFNPRSHKGNDKIKQWNSMNTEISIHVPTRGTTHNRRLLSRQRYRFQSTFPQGERPSPPVPEPGKLSISIHVPTRGTTLIFMTASSQYMISIHVPTRGTTNQYDFIWFRQYISIHVPTRGTTQ